MSGNGSWKKQNKLLLKALNFKIWTCCFHIHPFICLLEVLNQIYPKKKTSTWPKNVKLILHFKPAIDIELKWIELRISESKVIGIDIDARTWTQTHTTRTREKRDIPKISNRIHISCLLYALYQSFPHHVMHPVENKCIPIHIHTQRAQSTSNICWLA